MLGKQAQTWGQLTWPQPLPSYGSGETVCTYDSKSKWQWWWSSSWWPWWSLSWDPPRPPKRSGLLSLQDVRNHSRSLSLPPFSHSPKIALAFPSWSCSQCCCKPESGITHLLIESLTLPFPTPLPCSTQANSIQFHQGGLGQMRAPG